MSSYTNNARTLLQEATLASERGDFVEASDRYSKLERMLSKLAENATASGNNDLAAGLLKQSQYAQTQASQAAQELMDEAKSSVTARSPRLEEYVSGFGTESTAALGRGERKTAQQCWKEIVKVYDSGDYIPGPQTYGDLCNSLGAMGSLAESLGHLDVARQRFEQYAEWAQRAADDFESSGSSDSATSAREDGSSYQSYAEMLERKIQALPTFDNFDYWLERVYEEPQDFEKLEVVDVDWHMIGVYAVNVTPYMNPGNGVGPYSTLEVHLYEANSSLVSRYNVDRIPTDNRWRGLVWRNGVFADLYVRQAANGWYQYRAGTAPEDLIPNLMPVESEAWQFELLPEGTYSHPEHGLVLRGPRELDRHKAVLELHIEATGQLERWDILGFYFQRLVRREREWHVLHDSARRSLPLQLYRDSGRLFAQWLPLDSIFEAHT